MINGARRHFRPENSAMQRRVFQQNSGPFCRSLHLRKICSHLQHDRRAGRRACDIAALQTPEMAEAHYARPPIRILPKVEFKDGIEHPQAMTDESRHQVLGKFPARALKIHRHMLQRKLQMCRFQVCGSSSRRLGSTTNEKVSDFYANSRPAVADHHGLRNRTRSR